MTYSDYVNVNGGVFTYDFPKIHSTEICQKIEDTCTHREKGQRVCAVAYMVAACAVSLLLKFSVINTVVIELATIYFFSSEAWKIGEHYANMKELAGLRIQELSAERLRSQQQLIGHPSGG